MYKAVYTESAMAGALGGLLRFRLFRQASTLVVVFLVCLIVSVTAQSTSRSSTLVPNSTAIIGITTLVSPGGVFELGFTSGVQSNLTVYALAIWYVQPTPKKVVWVADRSMALQSSTNASLSLSALGDLEVYDTSGQSPTLVWTSNTTNMDVVNATVEDTGNLVLRNAAKAVVWQSFDSPTDTLLPTQIFAANSSTAALIAWEDDDDWRNGNYSLRYNSTGNIVASWHVPYPYYTGPIWVNQSTGQPNYWTPSPPAFSYVFLTTAGEFQGVNASGNSSVISTTASHVGLQGRLLRLTFDKDGMVRMYSWSTGNLNWNVEWKFMQDECSIPGFCGPYSLCSLGGCLCPDGFQFVDTNDVRLGCQRIYPRADCNRTLNGPPDIFGPALNADWPYNDIADLTNVQLSFCLKQCLMNCDCQGIVAVPPDSFNTTTDCWIKEYALLMGTSSGINGVRLSYLRLAGQAPKLTPRRGNTTVTIVASTLGAAVAILAALMVCISWRMLVAPQKQRSRDRKLQDKWVVAKGAMIRFTYPEIVVMTANFGTKIGEGGFGTVFKGHIGDDVTVAVKRLNKEPSSHLEKEFLNEVDSIGLIHHFHLVSLLGYCAQANHRLLVYEYVDRGSLDRALFLESKSGLPVLEWRPRFTIAIQTARGLAYLHDDCNQRIIHCDVKPENILLDSSFNAKVADFGLSRIMKRNQTRTVTRSMHIRGTVGYIAPEWTSDHMNITNKVDVFSYGMVLLEIISGRRNLVADKMDAPDMYFPTWAFPKMEKDEVMDLVDPALIGIVNSDEVRRALQVAFWCINGNPHIRPGMSEVVQMLQGQVPIALPVPKPMTFFEPLDLDLELDYSDYSTLHWSISGATATPIDEAHASV